MTHSSLSHVLSIASATIGNVPKSIACPSKQAAIQNCSLYYKRCKYLSSSLIHLLTIKIILCPYFLLFVCFFFFLYLFFLFICSILPSSFSFSTCLFSICSKAPYFFLFPSLMYLTFFLLCQTFFKTDKHICWLLSWQPQDRLLYINVFSIHHLVSDISPPPIWTNSTCW